jgi:iron(III) transport system substrate-binding protein
MIKVKAADFRKFLFGGIFAAAGILSGCVAGAPAGSGTAPSAPPMASGEVVLYSGREESLVAPLLVKFSEATGITVKVKYGSTAELAATLLEEGSRSPADVFWAQDPGGLGAVAAANLLAMLPPSTLELVPANFRSTRGDWVGVSGRARVVVYNTDKVQPADLPPDMWGFTEPQWEGRIGWAPTNGSFQVMVTAMRKLWGEDKTRAWLQAIIANDAKEYPKNTALVQAVANAEVEVGFTNHYYLLQINKEAGTGLAAANYFVPGGGPGSLVMVAGVGQLASAPNSANAQRFMEYLLEPATQRYFALNTFEYPLIEGVEIAAGLQPLASLNTAALGISDLTDTRGTVNLLKDVGALE